MRDEVEKRKEKSQLGLINPKGSLPPGDSYLAMMEGSLDYLLVFFLKHNLIPEPLQQRAGKAKGSEIHGVQQPQTTLSKQSLCKCIKSHVVMDR